MRANLTNVPGILVGHATDQHAGTGGTVVLAVVNACGDVRDAKGEMIAAARGPKGTGAKPALVEE